METLDPNSSPIKRQKTSLPQSHKGKAPITPDDDFDDEFPPKPPPQCCGICFSDEGKTFRGLIDSCHHYFCFLCVIEWSKIDSRCPLCRGRFSTVRRVRKDGSFIGDGVVRIPVRDQIYDPFGDPVDPYGDAKCSVCNGTKDESLLLLCDLCDSAMHTYCVGLGYTVPEGDWYCRDCDLLRAEAAEQHESDHDDNVESSTILEQHEGKENESDRQLPSAPVSIFDIVSEEPSQPIGDIHSGTDRLLKLISSATKFSSAAIVSDQTSAGSSGRLPTARREFINASESSARTLRNCRNVHRHISVLRDNWDAFRTGSLSFSSNLAVLRGRDSHKLDEAADSAKGSCQLQSVSRSSMFSKSKVKDDSCNATQDQGSYNIERAWKLMNIAKSRADKAKSVSKATANKVSFLKVETVTPKCVSNGKTGNLFPRMRVQNGTHKVNGRLSSSGYSSPIVSGTSSGKFQNYSGFRSSTAAEVRIPRQNYSYISYNEKTCLASPEELQRGEAICYDSICSTSSHEPRVNVSDVSCSNVLSVKSTSTPKQRRSRKVCAASKVEVQSSVQIDNHCGRVVLPSHPSLGHGSSNVSAESKHSTSLVSPCEISPRGSGASCPKTEEKKVHLSLGKSGAKVPIKISEDDEAKGEILSLVKLNMKLLAKGKRLGRDEYKETARVSTHTILAACGYEHRNIVCSVPKLVCHHSKLIQQPPRCGIANSCQECFHAFVKDVVNSILSKKLDTAEVGY